MLTLGLNARHEKNPRAVMPDTDVHGNDTVTVDTLCGSWLRVFPHTARDVMFIRGLVMHVHRFAPADGIGVLVAAKSLPGVVTQTP